MKKVAIIISTIIISILILISILTSTGTNQKVNSFQRKFSSIHFRLKTATLLPNNLFGFVGDSDQAVFLNNYSYTHQKYIYKIDLINNRIDTTPIIYPPLFNIEAHNIYKDYYNGLTYASNPYGDIAICTHNAGKYFRILKPRLDVIKTISPQTIVARFRYNTNKNINRGLIKISLSKQTKKKHFFFEPKSDAFFANDGLLIYNSNNSKIIYMNYYRGEFLTLDTNLALLYKGKTIDTVLNPTIKTGISNIKTQDGNNTKQLTLSTPPKFVNKFISSSNNNIFILSALKADNEVGSERTHNTIDVYDIKTGTYKYSFYIPNYQGRKLDQFKIIDHTLFAIHGAFFISYAFNENIE
ncbi:hypothetical protein LPB86_08775 [Pedobacter sp. MC2016-14]|uniref:hypothetical protein n=1 Tax=Pedobacter sp. MC2016-14 TaxID=2897327 RepID=UPI001E5461DC|nr:hypothetical protein [Pedobacter sp. MC2016-14]MCD0488321.1 hypothetical protein [Pedobacter sp. MC2016-14]